MSSELCVPVGAQPTTVQLLVHSTWYNHKYFDPPQAAYSYVRSAVDSGYATFNIDSAAQTVTVMDVASGKALQTARVEGAPTTLLRTADGRRLLALERGEGFDCGDEGFRAKTKSALTIIDGRSLAVQARVELGTGLEDAVMLAAAGDRLSVVCPGM